jgi:hypothetical protein
MKTLRWIVLAGMVFIPYYAGAQAKIGVTIDTFVTQVAVMDTAQRQFTMHVHNYGNLAFNDTVALEYSVNGTLYSANIMDHGLYLPIQTFSIPPFDSVPTTLKVNFNLPAFLSIGSSAVVIWPKASGGAATYDSLFYQVQITFPAAANTIAPENLHVFVNQGQLFINTNTPNLLNRVRIYDIRGQLLVQQSISSSTTLPMNTYATGCYLVEVILNDDSKQVFRVVNINNH